MIEEVVSSILEAEDVAQKRIDAAKLEANNIVSSAEAETDKYKKQTAARNKQAFVEGMQNVEQYAKQTADAMLEELNAEADKEMAKYEKNVGNAVKIILEHLI